MILTVALLEDNCDRLRPLKYISVFFYTEHTYREQNEQYTDFDCKNIYLNFCYVRSDYLENF